jgi:multidrug resistance efflux pump
MNPSTDRVRAHTAKDVLRRIDDDMNQRLIEAAEASHEATSQRLKALEREWDTDRALEIEAATVGLLGLALGVFARTSLLALPAVVAASVLAHAATRHYPLMPLFRRFGLRTSREIARERYALKALRGDFAGMPGGRQPADAATARSSPAADLH